MFKSQVYWCRSLVLMVSAFVSVQSVDAAEIAPYFYTWGGAKYNSLMGARNASGLKSATYAFAIAASNGSCALGGDLPQALPDIRNFISSGGSLIISFGGAAGTYVEVACSDENQLFNLIDKVIVDTGTQRLDFDVEGHQLTNTVSHGRRARVLARLRAKYPNLYLSVTLPGWTDGLTPDGLNVIKQIENAGVRLNIINVMTMGWDQVEKTVSPPTLGQWSMQSINSTVHQLKSIYPAKTTAQIFGMIGICPMIGDNIGGVSLFTLADAQTITNYAKANGVGLLTYWAFNRDVAQAQNGLRDLNAYSGVAQSDFQFYNIFRGAESVPVRSPASEPVATPAPVTACNYPNWVNRQQYAAGSIVKFTDGKLYRAKFANPGYTPTVSTYYWEGFNCTSTDTPPPSTPVCSATHPNWINRQQYAAGSIVRYSDNKLYKAKYANPGYIPTVSTYYWAPICQ